MLQWFSKLSSVEKCAAMAIYDDSIFIQFYIDLYKLHIKSVKEVGNFSLFSKETVHHYYEIAKTAQKKSKISKKPLANFSSDSSTLEYLTGTNRELHDIDEFENPFDIESMQSVSPTSTQLCARAVHSRNLTYLVAAANVEDILGVAMENATRKIERKGLSAGSFLRYLSDNLHKSILLASANGSETDTLFCRYGTNDVSKFIKMTNVLSSNHMFTHVPSPNEIKALMSGKPFPDLKWVQYPVACYNLLLARIEISMWAAFYACGGNIESPGTTLLPIANTADKENNRVSSIDSRYGLSTGMNIKKKDNSASSTIVPLSSLSQSPLLKLHSAAAMLTLGCIVEELKLFWSRLSDRSKTDLMVDTPQMLAHHSDLRRCYQRSETVIDRAVLCPFEWAIQQDSSAHSQLMLDRLKALRADASMRELLSEEVEGIQSEQIENPYHTAVRQDKNNSNSNNSTAPSVPHTRASTDQNQTAVSTHPTLKFRGSSVAVQSRAASKELNIIAPLVTTALTPALPTSTPSTLDQSTSFLNLPATSHESFRFHFNHLGPTDDPSMEQLLRDERQIGAEGKSSAPDIEAPAAVKKKRKNKKKKKKSVANIESTSIGILSSEVALDDDGNDEDDDDDRVNESSAEEVNSPIITEPNLITETVTPLEEVNPKDISKSIDQSPAIVASISTLPLELKTVEVKMPVPNVSEIDMNRDVSDHKMFSASDMHGYADSDMYEIILDGRPLLEDEGGFVTVQHRKETKPKQQPPQKPQQQSQFQPPLHHQQQQTSQSRSKASETSQDSKASNASSNIKKKEKQVVPEKSSTVSKKTSPTAKPAVVPKTVATVSKVTTSSPSVVQPALSAQTDSKVTVPDRTEFEFLGDATIPVIELSSTSEVVPPTIPAPSLEKPIEVTEAPISLETLATTSNVVAPPEVSMPITASVEDVITDEAGAEDISTHATTQVASDQERARQSMDFEPFYLESSSTSDNPRKGSAAAATAVHANAKTQIQEENTLQLQRRLTKNIRRFNTVC